MPITITKKEIILILVLILLGVTYYFTISSPYNYPQGAIINIREGAGLLEVGETLKEKNIIRSQFWFRTAAISLGGERGLKAGDYFLERRENAFKIAWRIIHGKRNIETVKMTIPEGFTKKDISELFNQKFPKFDKSAFIRDAKEGYLFPDTYFVEVSATASSTITLLSNNFDLKIAPYKDEIASSTHPLDQLITMASIIESEAQTKIDRDIISGILWKRIKLNMPLQVDATLKYVTGKGTSELTNDDLKLESFFNTYIHLGLPPTPISNPGIEAIISSLRPKESDYLYFLTDKDGVMHYAKTFEEHKKNKEKYLNN